MCTTTSAFLCGLWGSELSSHAYIASTLPIEPSPQLSLNSSDLIGHSDTVKGLDKKETKAAVDMEPAG